MNEITAVLTVLTAFRGRVATRPRDESGLSQTTEAVLLVLGTIAVATLVIVAVTAYIRGKAGQLN